VPLRFAALLSVAVLAVAGCGPSSEPDLVWGKRGVLDGDIVRPRAAVIDGDDRLWIVDFTARIQAYDLDGNYLGPTFTPPDFRNGRPSGLGITRDGRLIVCDSHYHCLRIYAADGTEVRKLGGDKGSEPGQFGYVSDAVQDADGFFYVSEFGINERITKLDADGKFVAAWGKSGTAEGEFNRIRALALGGDGLLYVADSCNHRIQVFERTGKLVRVIGTEGAGSGELKYPYDLAFAPAGDLYVVERGNHRVQKFSAAGVSLGVWGGAGRKPGQLADPWALVVDKKGRVHVIDTENHRVQRIEF
jgi:DNA-binding beta-propeller fold protein YncE